MTILRTSSLSP